MRGFAGRFISMRHRWISSLFFEYPHQQGYAPVAGNAGQYNDQNKDGNRNDDGEFFFHDAFYSRKLYAGFGTGIFRLQYFLLAADVCLAGIAGFHALAQRAPAGKYPGQFSP